MKMIQSRVWDTARVAGYDMLTCYDLADLLPLGERAGGAAARLAEDAHAALRRLASLDAAPADYDLLGASVRGLAMTLDVRVPPAFAQHPDRAGAGRP